MKTALRLRDRSYDTETHDVARMLSNHFSDEVRNLHTDIYYNIARSCQMLGT